MKEELAFKLLRSKYGDISDEDLVELIAEKLDVELNTDPVNHIHELEDSADKCFVWDVDMTDRQIIEFTNQFKSEFVKKYNHDPSALHFVRNDINSIEELSPGEVRTRVQPWLNDKGEDK